MQTSAPDLSLPLHSSSGQLSSSSPFLNQIIYAYDILVIMHCSAPNNTDEFRISRAAGLILRYLHTLIITRAHPSGGVTCSYFCTWYHVNYIDTNLGSTLPNFISITDYNPGKFQSLYSIIFLISNYLKYPPPSRECTEVKVIHTGKQI